MRHQALFGGGFQADVMPAPHTPMVFGHLPGGDEYGFRNMPITGAAHPVEQMTHESFAMMGEQAAVGQGAQSDAHLSAP